MPPIVYDQRETSAGLVKHPKLWVNTRSVACIGPVHISTPCIQSRRLGPKDDCHSPHGIPSFGDHQQE